MDHKLFLSLEKGLLSPCISHAKLTAIRSFKCPYSLTLDLEANYGSNSMVHIMTYKNSFLDMLTTYSYQFRPFALAVQLKNYSHRSWPKEIGAEAFFMKNGLFSLGVGAKYSIAKKQLACAIGLDKPISSRTSIQAKISSEGCLSLCSSFQPYPEASIKATISHSLFTGRDQVGIELHA